MKQIAIKAWFCMPEKAAEEVRKVARGVKDETKKLVKELRETRKELTPRPIRRFLEERLKRRRR